MDNNLSTASFPKEKKSKKVLRKALQEKLTVTLADYKSVLGNRRFESRIKKVARSLGADIIKSLPKRSKKEQENIEEAEN